MIDIRAAYEGIRPKTPALVGHLLGGQGKNLDFDLHQLLHETRGVGSDYP